MAISTLVHGSGIVTKVTMPSMFQPNVGRLFKTAVRERSRSMGATCNRTALAWFCCVRRRYAVSAVEPAFVRTRRLT